MQTKVGVLVLLVFVYLVVMAIVGFSNSFTNALKTQLILSGPDVDPSWVADSDSGAYPNTYEARQWLEEFVEDSGLASVARGLADVTGMVLDLASDPWATTSHL